VTTPVNEQRVGELVSLDYYFARLRERLAALSGDELQWQPTTDDRVTIAWRLGHIPSFLREERNWRWLGQQPVRRDGDEREATTASDAIAQLDPAIDRATGTPE
jgi:hypothetical protein